MYICYLAEVRNFEPREFNNPCLQESVFEDYVKNIESKPHTIIEKSDSIVEDLETYDVDITVNIKKSGYIYNSNGPIYFEDFYSMKKFKVHLYQKKNILYINNSKQLAFEFEKVTKEAFDLKIVNINLSSLIMLFNDISGIWFSKINDTNVNAASIHGNNVDNSYLYDLLKDNKISSININYPYNKMQYNIMITKNGVINILTTCSAVIRLSLLTELTENYLKPNFI